MINTEEVLAEVSKESTRRLAEDLGMAYSQYLKTYGGPAKQSPEIRILVTALVNAVNKELDANSLRLGPSLKEINEKMLAATDPDVTKVPIVPEVKVVPVDSKGQKTPCFEAPGARGTTVIP